VPAIQHSTDNHPANACRKSPSKTIVEDFSFEGERTIRQGPRCRRPAANEAEIPPLQGEQHNDKYCKQYGNLPLLWADGEEYRFIMAAIG